MTIFFTACGIQKNSGADYVVELKDNYWSIIIPIRGALLGAVIGGLITLWVSLKIQKREKAITYAQNNRKQIYEPLYEEIVNKPTNIITRKTFLLIFSILFRSFLFLDISRHLTILTDLQQRYYILQQDKKESMF